MASDDGLQPADINRLRWSCRRGMRELDLMFLAYLDHCYAGAEPQEQQRFRQLLEQQDQTLMGWMLGQTSPTDKGFTHVIERIRTASQN